MTDCMNGTVTLQVWRILENGGTSDVRDVTARCRRVDDGFEVDRYGEAVRFNGRGEQVSGGMMTWCYAVVVGSFILD